MRTKMYSRKLRQFKYRSKELNRLIESGAYSELGSSAKRRLLSKIRQLYQSLQPYFGSKKLRPILAGAALMLGLAAPMKAQQFAPSVLNPYGLIAPGPNLNFVSHADLDGDGDTDVMAIALPYSIYPGNFMYYENIGTNDAPEYALPVENPFNLSPGFAEIALTMGDLDNDGDMDIITGEGYNAGFHFFENIGDAENPDFAPFQSNPFGLTGLSYYIFPALADIDGDGDLDLFGGDSTSDLHFFVNEGTPEEPEFSFPDENPLGIQGGEGLIIPAFADIDNDSDLDLVYGDYNYGGVFLAVQINEGSPGGASFGPVQQNPFGLNSYGYLAIPTIFDMDGDGDMDILTTTSYYGNFAYFENVDEWAVADDAMVVMEEDSEYFFDEIDFNYDNSSGNFLAFVQIESLPTVGTLNFNGAPVELYQQISPDELGSLSFVPLAGEFGDPYDSFTFKVADDEGTFNVGEYTMTIAVTEVSSTKEVIAGLQAGLYPNPVQDNLVLDLQFEEVPEQLLLEVKDMLGRTLHQSVLTPQTNLQEELHVGDWPSGTYFLRLIADDQQQSFSFVKQ